MHYLLCSRSLSSLQHLLSFRCLFHYGSSLPGVKTLVCLCVLFSFYFFLFLFFKILCWMFTWILSSFSLPLPHCLGQVLAYLQLSVVSPSISIFLPLVCPFLSSLSHSLSLLWQASKQTAYNTEAHQAASAVRSTHPSHPSCCTTEALPSFICEQRLNQEIRADQPSAPCGLLFILNFLITLALAYWRAEFHSHVLDANMQRHSDKQTSI